MSKPEKSTDRLMIELLALNVKKSTDEFERYIRELGKTRKPPHEPGSVIERGGQKYFIREIVLIPTRRESEPRAVWHTRVTKLRKDGKPYQGYRGNTVFNLEFE